MCAAKITNMRGMLRVETRTPRLLTFASISSASSPLIIFCRKRTRTYSERCDFFLARMCEKQRAWRSFDCFFPAFGASLRFVSVGKPRFAIMSGIFLTSLCHYDVYLALYPATKPQYNI